MTNKERKLKSYRYYVINIKIRRTDSKEDISEGEYAELFRRFYLSFTTGKSSKQKECLIMTMSTEFIEEHPSAYGQLVQVTLVNNKKWFNRAKVSLDTEFKIPSEYAANAAVTEYLFIPGIHRFCYRIKSSDFIAPYAVKEYFKNALNKFLHDGYFAQVDVVSDPVTIERIYEAPEIRSLEIKINYSNNDFGEELQKFVEDDLRNSNIGEITIKARVKPENSIDLDQSKILGGALQSSVANGEVTAKIVDGNGKKMTIKTKDNPLKVEINATEETKNSVIYNIVTNEARKDDQSHQ